MKIVRFIRDSPDGTGRAGQSVSLRRISDGSTILSATTDDDGFVTIERDGHLEPYYLYIGNMHGGDKLWRSDEVKVVGATNPRDWPVAFRVMGNGVVAGYGNEMLATINGDALTMRGGGMVILGHPVVCLSTTINTLTRPHAATRIDRIVLRLYPDGSATTPGKADLVTISGVTGDPAPSLTQNTTVFELPLWRVNVPSAGSITLEDERQMLQSERHDPVQEVDLASGPLVTSSASGEALAGLSATLLLPDEGTYDIFARVSGVQGDVAGSTEWSSLAEYGPTFNGLSLSNPGQVAVDSSGKKYIADTGNNRLVILNADGTYNNSITGLNAPLGVAIDSSGNIIVANSGADAAVYSSSLSLLTTLGTSDGRHVATGGLDIYITRANNTIRKYRWVGAGWTESTIGSSGSGNGQLNTPYGICYNATDSLIYVVDQGNSRVQAFTTSGTYQRQWAVAAGCRGIVADASGDVWVCSFLQSKLYQYSSTGTLLETLDQGTPSGIGIASGDVLWVSSTEDQVVAKWDEVTAGAGYGSLALEIDGSGGTYLGIGNRNGTIVNADSGSKAGGFGSSVTVRAFGKAVSGDATFRNMTLFAKAMPRR